MSSPHIEDQTIVLNDQKYVTIMIPIVSLLPNEVPKLGSEANPMQVRDYQKFSNDIYFGEMKRLTTKIYQDDMLMRCFGA